MLMLYMIQIKCYQVSKMYHTINIAGSMYHTINAAIILSCTYTCYTRGCNTYVVSINMVPYCLLDIFGFSTLDCDQIEA